MDFFNPSYLVHIGAILYIAAFLVRGELLLRSLALAGSVLYLLYYFLAPAVPLWDAIFTGTILILANVYVMLRIVLERTIFGLSEEEKQLFWQVELLTPGQFRKLLKLSERHTATGEERLTVQGEIPDGLFYVVSGLAKGQKNAQHFTISEGHFIGEIAFVLDNHVASADVTAEQGMEYYRWDVKTLRMAMEKSGQFKNAMVALLSRDLAGKLGISFKSD